MKKIWSMKINKNVHAGGTDLGVKHCNGPSDGVVCGSLDGPRHMAGWSAIWRRSGSSSAYVRTVRVWSSDGP
jgi:hypothetical protein